MGTFLAGLALLALAHTKLVPGLSREVAWHPLVNGTLLVGLATWVAAVVLEVTSPAPHRQGRWTAGSVAAFLLGWTLMPELGGGPWMAFLAALGIAVLPALWAGPEPEAEGARPEWSRQAALVAAAAWFTFQALLIGSLLHPGFLDAPEKPAKREVPACGIDDAKLHQAFHFAILEKNTARVRELLAREPRLAKCQEDITSPLYTAVCTGDVELVRVLLDAGADPKKVGAYAGSSLLLTAVDRVGYGPMAVLLVERGADPNFTDRKDGMTPLHIAALHMDGWAIWNMIRRGANAKAVDATGRRPLDIARGRKDANAAKVIEVLEAASLR